MTTITTKQLRDNMSQVVRDLQNGESVQLSYRHQIIGTLQPVGPVPTAQRRGAATAVQHFLRAADFGPIPAGLQKSSDSFKREVAELRNRDVR